MLEVKEGQWVVVETRGYFRGARADRVTPKQIRTLGRGSSYDQEDRNAVIFAGTKDQVAAVLTSCDDQLQLKRAEMQRIRQDFEKEIAPAQERKDERESAATTTYRKAILAVLETATAGGEVSAQQE